MRTFNINVKVNATPAEEGRMEESMNILHNRVGGGLHAAGVEAQSIEVTCDELEEVSKEEEKKKKKAKAVRKSG